MTIKLLTYDEASKLTGIKIDTLYLMVMKGRIPHVRLGNRFVRFCQQDLIDWIESLKKGVAND